MDSMSVLDSFLRAIMNMIKLSSRNLVNGVSTWKRSKR